MGARITSTGICKQLKSQMHGQQFEADLRLLLLGGYDMVLGADWLRNLDDVIFNLAKLCISLKHQGTPITVKGVTSKPSLNVDKWESS